MGPCRHGMARPQVADEGTCLQYRRMLQLDLIRSRGQPTNGGLPYWWLGEVLTTPDRKTYLVTKPRN